MNYTMIKNKNLNVLPDSAYSWPAKVGYLIITDKNMKL